jgi:3-phosphoshikimate 1-carboxyvinyltransferase
METITIHAGKQIIKGSVVLPLSKSISNRILMINALSSGSVKYNEVSDADDTILMADLLDQIKAGTKHQLFAGNAGTVFRFIASYLAITKGEWILDGDARMRQRPVQPLVEALTSLGADIQYTDKQGYAPLLIHGKPLKGGKVEIDISDSSQFASSLIMVAPLFADGLDIHLSGTVSALPYIEMTIRLMQQAGIEILADLPVIRIKKGMFQHQVLHNENDWSSAAFWYELVALSRGGELFLPGLVKGSLQGDSIAAEYFGLMGVETSYHNEGISIRKSREATKNIQLDLNQCPDLAPPLVVSAAALGIRATFSGLKNLALKESNRLIALSTELNKIGIRSSITHNSISFDQQELKITKPIDPHGDHRMAMAFAPLAILGHPVEIIDPAVINKSYPGYWKQLKEILGAEQ